MTTRDDGELLKRADGVLVMPRAGGFAVLATNLERDNWIVSEVRTAGEADAVARQVAGWFRCAALLSDRKLVRASVERGAV